MPIRRVVKAFNSHKIRLDDASAHCLDGFYCANETLDKFIKEDALINQQQGKGVTTLIVVDDFGIVVAYYTLCMTAIFSEDNPQLIPSVELLMFAVNNCYQDVLIRESENDTGELVASRIFNSLLGDIYEISTEQAGCEYIVLHSVPDAVAFYKCANFFEMEKYIHPETDFEKGCIPMFMKLYPDPEDNMK